MKKRSFDYTMLVVTLILVMFGIVMVFSASFYYAENSANTDNNGFYYFWKQISGAALGLVAMIFFMFFDYKRLKKLRFWILGIGLVLMVLVFVPGIGISINGSRRWVNLYIIELQSVEVLKFSIIVFMAAGVSINKDKMDQFKYGMLPYLVLLLISAVLLYLQPNFSAVVTLALLIFVMMLVGGVSLLQFGLMGLLGLGGGTIAMLASEDATYRMNRILAFLHPWTYASNESYQLVQSLYSIGSGGYSDWGLATRGRSFCTCRTASRILYLRSSWRNWASSAESL